MTEKLDKCEHDRYGYEGCAACSESKIEELEKENKRLRAALDQFLIACDHTAPIYVLSALSDACANARRSLTGT